MGGLEIIKSILLGIVMDKPLVPEVEPDPVHGSPLRAVDFPVAGALPQLFPLVYFCYVSGHFP